MFLLKHSNLGCEDASQVAYDEDIAEIFNEDEFFNAHEQRQQTGGGARKRKVSDTNLFHLLEVGHDEVMCAERMPSNEFSFTMSHQIYTFFSSNCLTMKKRERHVDSWNTQREKALGFIGYPFQSMVSYTNLIQKRQRIFQFSESASLT